MCMNSMATSPPKKKQKKRPLNIRERKFIKGIIAGKTAAQAMREAGYSERTSLCCSTQKLRETSETIQALMNKKGISDDYLLDGLLEGTKATKVISATIIARNGEGMKDADSMSKDFIDVDDFPTRHKYIETGLKLKGHLRDKLDVEHSGNITVIFEDPFGQTDKG